MIFQGPAVGSGEEGEVYESTDGEFIPKISTNGNPVCIERGALDALNGLGGYFPRRFQLVDHSSYCNYHSLVIEKVGDSDWRSFPHKLDDDFYTRAATLMEAIKTLHSTGIRHGDLHASNIRLDSQDPTKIYIIDFGLAGDSGISRKLDMSR